MGQILIRRLDDSVVAALKERAAQENMSLEATVRQVLTQAVLPDRREVYERLSWLRASQKPGRGPDVVTLLRAVRKRRSSAGAA